MIDTEKGTAALHVGLRRAFRSKRIAVSCVVLAALAGAGCGPFDDEDSGGADTARLVTVEDLDRYPDDSPEAAFLKHYFYIQWGSARNVVAALDPRVPRAVGVPELIDAYAFLRPGLAASRLRFTGKMNTREGALITFEVLPRSGAAQSDSALLRKTRDDNYVILYDGLLDRGIPGSIRAAAAGEPATAERALRTQRRINAVMRRYHAAAGTPARTVASRTRGRRNRTPPSPEGPPDGQRGGAAAEPGGGTAAEPGRATPPQP